MLKLTTADGEVFEGKTFLDLVCAMKGATMFSDAKSVLGYIAAVQNRAKEIEGVDINVTGDKIDERCESLVRELERTKLAVIEPVPGCDVNELKRMVHLCADILNAGDFAGTWAFLRTRIRIPEAELRVLDERLGLATPKP